MRDLPAVNRRFPNHPCSEHWELVWRLSLAAALGCGPEVDYLRGIVSVRTISSDWLSESWGNNDGFRSGHRSRLEVQGIPSRRQGYQRQHLLRPNGSTRACASDATTSGSRRRLPEFAPSSDPIAGRGPHAS